MKKVLGVCVVLLLILIAATVLHSAEQDTQTVPSTLKIVTPTPSVTSHASRSLFVPYWSLRNESIDASLYDQLIYFGITTNTNGIDTKEKGYQELPQFFKVSDTKIKKILTLRMITQDTNFTILKNKQLQKHIIDQTITVAKTNRFDGILVDLEVSSFPFQSVVSDIDDFVNAFHSSAQQKKLQFDLALFGDTFYRIRPYDLPELAKQSDMIYIMSYDFHKAGGAPGPNFPLSGQKQYGYDFKTMVTDFLNFVPKEKLAIVFGMFGYDWLVDDAGKAANTAKSRSLLEMQQLFINSCLFSRCSVLRDSSQSAEMHVTYTDNDGGLHDVWFEDQASVTKKEMYLKQKGITSFAFWAYSYF